MTWDYKRDFKSLANAVKMQGTFLSDKSLSQYLLKVIQPGILRRNNLKILRQDVKNGCECSSITVRQKQSPLYLHTLGPEPAV